MNFSRHHGFDLAFQGFGRRHPDPEWPGMSVARAMARVMLLGICRPQHRSAVPLIVTLHLFFFMTRHAGTTPRHFRTR